MGYISLGKGVTIHRADCKNARAWRSPGISPVAWAGRRQPFRVEIRSRRSIAATCWRTWRGRSRTRASTSSPNNVQTLPDSVVRDRFTLEVGDVHQLDNILANIRAIATVYDAYRVVGG